MHICMHDTILLRGPPPLTNGGANGPEWLVATASGNRFTLHLRQTMGSCEVWPQQEVPSGNRCSNRFVTLNGTHTQWIKNGVWIAVLEVVIAVPLPDNGGKDTKRRVVNGPSKATLDVSGWMTGYNLGCLDIFYMRSPPVVDLVILCVSSLQMLRNLGASLLSNPSNLRRCLRERPNVERAKGQATSNDHSSAVSQ